MKDFSKLFPAMKDFSKMTPEELENELDNDGNFVVLGPLHYDPEAIEFAKNHVSEFDYEDFDLEAEEKNLAFMIEDLYFRESAKRAGKFKTAFAGLKQSLLDQVRENEPLLKSL